MTQWALFVVLWSCFSGLLVVVGAPLPGHATPICLTRDDFDAQTSGLMTMVEDFEGYAIGYQPTPFSFLNGTYTGPIAFVIWDPDVCGGNYGKCQTANQIFYSRVYDVFPVGTAFWAADIYFIQPADYIAVTVVGGSEPLTSTCKESIFRVSLASQIHSGSCP